MTVLPPHKLITANSATRQGLCARCGEVSIKSGGSNRSGGTRWRCANQVNEYRKGKRAKERSAATKEARVDYGFTLIWPCCGATDPDPIEEPDEISPDGDATAEYPDAQCPGCGLVRTLRVNWYLEDDVETVEASVRYIENEQSYTNGNLQGPSQLATPKMTRL